MEEDILENAPKNSSASVDPCRGCEPSGERTSRSTRFLLAELVQRKSRWVCDMRASKGRTCGGDVVELMGQGLLENAWQDATEVRELQASWRLQKRRGRTKTSLQMPTECTLTGPSSSDLCSTAGTRRKWNLVGSHRAMMQKQGRCLGGKAFHALPMSAAQGSDVRGRQID